MNKALRILICSNAYPPNFIGGAELIAHYQAKELQRKGHIVQVFAGETSGNKPRYMVEDTKYDGLFVHRISLTSQDYNYEYINFAHSKVDEAYKKIILDFKPNIVHFHNIIGLSLNMVHIARRFGAHTVMTLHDYWGFCMKNTLKLSDGSMCSDHEKCPICLPFVHDGNNRMIPVRMRMDYFQYQMEGIDCFISPSSYLASAYINAGFSAEKMHVLWNGIDIGKFSNIRKKKSSKEVRFTYIGYFGQHKGVDVFLAALNHCRHKDRIMINLVGDGEQKQAYINYLESHCLREKVKFWGKIDNKDIAQVYSETDVYVLPSIWPENQPVTITEAMASGIPVIASGLGGCNELVDSGVTGFLFESGSYRDLADKMDSLIDEPLLIEEMGRAGFAKIKSFGFDKQVESLVNLYTEIRQYAVSHAFKLATVSGERIREEFSQGLQKYCDHNQSDRWHFVHREWLDDDQYAEAKLLCIAGDKWLPHTISALAAGTCLLVPEVHEELRNLCSTRNCGLYYSDEFEVEHCLKYLQDDEKCCAALGLNGSKLISLLE